MSDTSNMKKVLVISNMFPSSEDPYYGTFVKNFFDDLSSTNRFKASLIAIKGRKLSTFSKVWAYIIFYLKIIWTVGVHNFDLIYTHTISHTTPPLRIISLFKKLNTIYNIHGDDLLTTTKLSKYLLKFALPLLSKSKAIVVPSNYFKEVLYREIPFTQGIKIIISPSGGVSKTFFKYKLSENRIPIIGYVSRIDSGKGWDILLEALSEISGKHIPFKAYLYGRGEQEAQLRSSIVSKNLEEFVSYEGPRSHDELTKLYSNFDVFIFPTIRYGESLGLVGIEAMAGSVPVIGSNIGGLKSYIKDGVNGFLFEPGNYKDLADKILNYISMESSDKIIMRQSAYRTALEYESTQVNNKLFNQILEILDNN